MLPMSVFYLAAGEISHLIASAICFISLITLARKIPTENTLPILSPLCLIFALSACILTYAAVMELFIAYFSGAQYDIGSSVYLLRTDPAENPFSSPSLVDLWINIGLSLLPLLLFSPKIRHSVKMTLIISLIWLTPSLIYRIVNQLDVF